MAKEISVANYFTFPPVLQTAIQAATNRRECGACYGSGVCPVCTGSGEVDVDLLVYGIPGKVEPCLACFQGGECKTCNGTGKIDPALDDVVRAETLLEEAV